MNKTNMREKVEQVRQRFEAAEKRKRLEQIELLKNERIDMMRNYVGHAKHEFNYDWVVRRWAVDQRYMTLQEFIDFIWPEDCQEKTFFLLKYIKEIKNGN